MRRQQKYVLLALSPLTDTLKIPRYNGKLCFLHMINAHSSIINKLTSRRLILVLSVWLDSNIHHKRMNQLMSIYKIAFITYKIKFCNYYSIKIYPPVEFHKFTFYCCQTRYLNRITLSVGKTASNFTETIHSL